MKGMPTAECRLPNGIQFGIGRSALGIESMVVTRDVTVSNERGLHARPAMQFVDIANGFSSSVTVSKDGDDPLEVDGKSVMQMITLEATQGTVLHLKAEGDDADKAIGKLAELFETKFGEE